MGPRRHARLRGGGGGRGQRGKIAAKDPPTRPAAKRKISSDFSAPDGIASEQDVYSFDPDKTASKQTTIKRYSLSQSRDKVLESGSESSESELSDDDIQESEESEVEDDEPAKAQNSEENQPDSEEKDHSESQGSGDSQTSWTDSQGDSQGGASGPSGRRRSNRLVHKTAIILQTNNSDDDESDPENRQNIEMNIYDPDDPDEGIGTFHPILNTPLCDDVTIPKLKNRERQKARVANDEKWLSTEPDQRPNLPVFNSYVGLQHPPVPATPREYFRLMLPETFFENMVLHTNKYHEDYPDLVEKQQQKRNNGKLFYFFFIRNSDKINLLPNCCKSFESQISLRQTW